MNQDCISPPEVEVLDGLVGQGCQSAEHKCRHRRPEWYSQSIVQARLEVQLLRCQLRALAIGSTRQVALNARAHSVGIPCNITDSKDEMHHAFQIAKRHLQQLCLEWQI